MSPFVADFVGLTNRMRARVADGRAEVLGGSIPLLPGSASGPDALVLVRPEGVTVAPAGSDTSGPAVATVESTSFLGGHGRVVARTGGGESVTVQVPNTDVTRYRAGDTVLLGLRGDAALAVATG